MRRKTLKIFLIIESIAIILMLSCVFYEILFNNYKTRLLQETSPDGNYTVAIWELWGKPVFYRPVDHIKVTLYENNHSYSADFDAYIPTGGDTAKWEIDWMEDGVQIVLSGYKARYYILPFEPAEDAEILK